MKVILLEDVKNLGKKNTVVDVKDGYATNYLIPNHLAEYCTAKNENELNARLQKIAEEEAKRREEATALKNKIDNLTITLSLKTNNGQAFGSISQKQIIDALKQQGITLDHTALDKSIKLGFGEHHVNVKLYKDIEATLLVNVEEKK